MVISRWEAMINRRTHVPINDEIVGDTCYYCWRPAHIECIKCKKKLCVVHLEKECKK